MPDSKLWYILRNQEQSGPYSSSKMCTMASSKQLVPSDFVWKEGMEDWIEAKRIAGLFSVVNIEEHEQRQALRDTRTIGSPESRHQTRHTKTLTGNSRRSNAHSSNLRTEQFDFAIVIPLFFLVAAAIIPWAFKAIPSWNNEAALPYLQTGSILCSVVSLFRIKAYRVSYQGVEIFRLFPWLDALYPWDTIRNACVIEHVRVNNFHGHETRYKSFNLVFNDGRKIDISRLPENRFIQAIDHFKHSEGSPFPRLEHSQTGENFFFVIIATITLLLLPLLYLALNKEWSVVWSAFAGVLAVDTILLFIMQSPHLMNKIAVQQVG